MITTHAFIMHTTLNLSCQHICRCIHHVSKKLCKLIFCQNFVKFGPIVKIFGIKIAKRTSFSELLPNAVIIRLQYT